MNIEQAQDAIGKMVRVSDGTKRPPERFNRKLEAWKHKNYTGRLDEVREKSHLDGFWGVVCQKECSYMVVNNWTDINNIVEVV